jgi:hypothetical protein
MHPQYSHVTTPEEGQSGFREVSVARINRLYKEEILHSSHDSFSSLCFCILSTRPIRLNTISPRYALPYASVRAVFACAVTLNIDNFLVPADRSVMSRTSVGSSFEYSREPCRKLRGNIIGIVLPEEGRASYCESLSLCNTKFEYLLVSKHVSMRIGK